MNIEQLKIILKGKNVADLKTIIYNVYDKVPEAKDFIDVSVPVEKKVIKKNTEQLFKRYKKKIQDYIFPQDFETEMRDDEALEFIERIRKKDISPKFTIDCELWFVECCVGFVVDYSYFDEYFYITIDEVFESACLKIKANNLTEAYFDTIKKLISVENIYEFEFSTICKKLDIYKTLQ